MGNEKLSKSRYKKNPHEHVLTYYVKLYSDGDLFRTQKKAGRLHINKKAFKKQVDRDEHYLRKIGGYAIAEIVLEDLYDKDLDKIVIKEYVDQKWERTLISYLEDWKEHGVEWKTEPYEKQIALSEEHMIINE